MLRGQTLPPTLWFRSFSPQSRIINLGTTEFLLFLSASLNSKWGGGVNKRHAKGSPKSQEEKHTALVGGLDPLASHGQLAYWGGINVFLKQLSKKTHSLFKGMESSLDQWCVRVQKYKPPPSAKAINLGSSQEVLEKSGSRENNRRGSVFCRVSGAESYILHGKQVKWMQWKTHMKNIHIHMLRTSVNF